MADKPVTLDLSKSVPITLDMSKSVPLPGAAPTSPPVVSPPPEPMVETMTGIGAEGGQPMPEVPASVISPLARAPSGLMMGAVREAAKTATGIPEAISPGSTGVFGEVARSEPESMAEKVGGLAEQVGEFASGAKLLRGAATLVKAHKALPGVLALIEQYPKAAKLLLSMGEAGAVGAAQGAVKGAGEGKAVEEAVAGGVGGAVGGAVAAGAAPGLKALARITGIGGLTAEEAFVKAGRPSVKEGARFKESIQEALPILKDLKFKNVGEFVEKTDDAAHALWTDVVMPQVERHADEAVDVLPVAKNVRAAVTDTMEYFFPEEAAQIKTLAEKLEASRWFKLSKANEFISGLNAKLGSFYKMSPEARAAAGKTDGLLAGYEAAADGLREQVYGKLAALGEETPSLFRRQYGALKDVLRVFGKRATVEERQAPMNITQIIGAIEAAGAIAAGVPGAGVAGAAMMAVPAIARMRQTSGSLLKQGIAAAGREAAPAATGVTGEAAKTAVPAAGAIAARASGFVRFEASDGSINDVPAEHLERARQIDPGLKVIE